MWIILKKAWKTHAAGAKVDVPDTDAQALITKGDADAIKDDPLTGAIDKLTTALTTGIEKAVDSAVKTAAKNTSGHVPFVTTGPVGQDSAGYSFLKAAAFCLGVIDADAAKEEIHVHNQLKALYKEHGFTAGHGAKSFLVPFATEHMPIHDSKGKALAADIRQRVKANQGQFDPDEAKWISAKTGFGQKALGTVSDTAGGVLVGFPSLGELIELQRNMEVFPMAGAREISLPPNGRIQFPKLTGGATANWIGEATSITESQETTGNLDLTAKKLGVFVKVNNELLRFASPSADGLVRMDMARVAALKADLAMLEGTGGTQIKGLLTYTTAPDAITTHVAFTVGANGNTFGPEDVALMEGKLPDAVIEPTAWVMRKNFFSVIMNRRAGSGFAADDGKGEFMFFPGRRSPAEEMPKELWGTKVVRSSQVSNTRVKGSGTDLTYVLLGHFPDWIVARSGVMEFAFNPYGESSFQNDQTLLRGIQHIDAGARHAASFVLCDTLLVA